MTTPAVRALSNHFPDCQIDFLTQRPANTVYQHSPYVRQVYTVRWKFRELFPLLGKIYREKYDLLVDFSGSSKTAVFSRFTRIPRRLGIDTGKKNWCFTDTRLVPQDITYAGDRKLDLLSALGIEADDSSLDFFITEDHKREFNDKARAWGINGTPMIAVSPVSKRDYKVWPPERFATICDRLVEQYKAQIFFLIGPGEKRFAENVQQRMQNKSLPIDENLSLYEAACLLDLATCYLGNDNGLMHLAIARKKPTFGIFGRPRAANWTAPSPIHFTLEYDPGCKDSCHYPSCELECLTGISTERVWQQLQLFLQQ